MKAAALGLLAVLLAGCDSQPAYERLEMDIYEIRRLCGKVGVAAFAKANDGTTLDPSSIQRGAAAQCELEYRIKQQEANKPF